MCGLFGYFIPNEREDIKIAAYLLAIQNENRGRDSWGVSNGVDIVKDHGPIVENLWRVPFPIGGLLIGHTRSSTIGESTKENAHPFLFEGSGGKVIGVHNGTIPNHFDLNKDRGVQLPVDSMHIFHSLANELPQSDLSGYGAIVYTQDDTLFMGKFNGGQLAVAKLKEGGIVWSSDQDHLKKALVASGIGWECLYDVKEGHLYYGMPEGDLGDTEDKIEIQKSERKYSGHSGMGFYQDRGKWNNQTRSWEHNHQEAVKSELSGADELVIRFRIMIEPGDVPDRIITSNSESKGDLLKDISLILAIKDEKERKRHLNDLVVNRKDDKIMWMNTDMKKCDSCGQLDTRRIYKNKRMCYECVVDVIESGGGGDLFTISSVASC